MILGITGPIGSGKDEICKILRRRGTYVIDADKIGRVLLGKVWGELVKTFGSKILNRGGGINRKKLGDIVFSDPNQLKKLNQLIHPLIKKEIEDQLGANAHSRLIAINAAVLSELGLIALCDEVWVVWADKEKRIRRLLKKMDRKKISNIMKSQMTKKEYFKIADQVIDNNNSKARLRDRIRQIWAKLK